MQRQFYFIIIAFLGIYCCSFSQQNTSQPLNLMPWPKEVNIAKHAFPINKNFTLSINQKSERVYYAATQFIRRLANTTGVFIEEGFPKINAKNAQVKVHYKNEAILTLDVDESYNLTVNKDGILIEANTDIGALHGLQTLFQLVSFNNDSYFFKGVTIKDNPRFKWRGLLIDVARHFQPVNVIKRNLDAMAFVKMNVFHWHLSDDQGFRIESKVYPKLHKLGSDGQYYTHQQIKEVVAYANKLGIRVIPEIDVPGHATAILTAYPELGSKDNQTYKIERFSGIFHPTLNPTKPEVYTFLDRLFKEITPLFTDAYFHIGGDENEGKHWNENKKIEAFKKDHNLQTNHSLQTYFNIRLEKILQKYGKKLIGWDEIMTPNMPKTAIIHSWRGKNEGFEKGTLIKAVKNGYQAILSNGFYIDRMQPVTHYYNCDPIADNKLTKEEQRRILGGEATMWGELITPLTIDSRIWPRTAAIAERFWSSKNITNIDNMRKRLEKISLQLEALGSTHLKNKDAILRNLTKGQDINALKILTHIYEPLKIYTRNQGGTEYKTFSPFTLFADACTTDAKDAFSFNTITRDFLKKPSAKNKEKIIKLLKKWNNGYHNFSQLKPNPLLKKITPQYQSLSQVCAFLLKSIKNNTADKKDSNTIKDSLEKIKKPMQDTELAIYTSLNKLVNYFLNTQQK